MYDAQVPGVIASSRKERILAYMTGSIYEIYVATAVLILAFHPRAQYGMQ
jgi:hypothetical protein